MASRYVDDLIDDDEVPELTDEDFARSIPFSQLPREKQELLLQIKHATIRPDNGSQPISPAQKEEVTLKLSRPTMDRLRASGTGWESRVEQALTDWLDNHPDQQKAS